MKKYRFTNLTLWHSSDFQNFALRNDLWNLHNFSTSRKFGFKIENFSWKKISNFLRFFYKFSMGLYLNKIPSVALQTRYLWNALQKTLILGTNCSFFGQRFSRSDPTFLFLRIVSKTFGAELGPWSRCRMRDLGPRSNQLPELGHDHLLLR